MLDPLSVAGAIVPWALPRPDSHASAPYLEAVRRIYAFSESRRTSQQVALGQRRKLDRMRLLLGALGNPQGSFASILVAGTKGKGSMAAMLAAILTAAGYRVGRYTQPHLYSYRERTWAAGDYISEGELQQAVEAMAEALAVTSQRAADLGPLTTFDVGTAMSLLHFQRSHVDIAVVEVGVGGTNDATNVLEPVLSLIGPVGLDHVEVLGHSLREIALHKFGVARAGRDLVVGNQLPEVQQTLRDAAQSLGVPCFELGRDFHWQAPNPTAGPLFDFTGSLGILGAMSLPLEGIFQRDNAAVAIAAAQRLGASGWPVSADAIRHGLAAVRWEGRFQTVLRSPLTIVDGAHNPTATQALAETMRAVHPGRDLTLILGMSDSKDLPGTLAELAPLAARAISTRSAHPRATDPEELAAVGRALGMDMEVVPDLGEALTRAWTVSPPDGVTLVTGSLFLVGDVLERLWQMQQAL